MTKHHFQKVAILITFDDGYRDFAEYAWPLLKKYGFTATVNLVVDQIGGYNAWDEKEYGEIEPLMNWQEIRKLQAEGVTFGSHTVNHVALDRVFPIKAWREMRQSRLMLEKALGVPVKQIAYPFGLHNRIVHLFAGLAGYAYAFTCQAGAVDPKHSMLAMPRLEIEGTHSLADFKGMVEAYRPNIQAENNPNLEPVAQ